MSGQPPDADRSQLRFAEQVKHEFAFLERRGFRCAGADPLLVRYVSWTRVISIYHERLSYEIGLAVAHRWLRRTEAFSMGELLFVSMLPDADTYFDFASTTAGGVAEGVRGLAVQLRACMVTGTLHDRHVFTQLRGLRMDRASRLAAASVVQQARAAADAAWAQGDLARVVESYAPHTAHLTKAELKRLEYARKHRDL